MTVEIQKQMFPYVQVALVIFTNLSRVTKMKHMASLFQLFFPGYDGNVCRGFIADYQASKREFGQVAVPVYSGMNRLSKLLPAIFN